MSYGLLMARGSISVQVDKCSKSYISCVCVCLDSEGV